MKKYDLLMKYFTTTDVKYFGCQVITKNDTTDRLRVFVLTSKKLEEEGCIGFQKCIGFQIAPIDLNESDFKTKEECIQDALKLCENFNFLELGTDDQHSEIHYGFGNATYDRTFWRYDRLVSRAVNRVALISRRGVANREFAKNVFIYNSNLYHGIDATFYLVYSESHDGYALVPHPNYLEYGIRTKR